MDYGFSRLAGGRGTTGMSQATINRRVLAATMAALLALGALALAGPRIAASAVKPGTVSVKVKRQVSQGSLLASGKVRARVALGLGGTVKVVARVLPNGGSVSKKVARARVLRFRSPGAKKTTLRLTEHGRSLIADCASKFLVVAARPVGIARSSRSSVARVTASIMIDNPSCAGQQNSGGTGGTGGGGDGN